MASEPYDKVVGAAVPGECEAGAQRAQADCGDSVEDAGGADETTGASPGTAQACNDLGLNSLQSNLERFGIKPPGVA